MIDTTNIMTVQKKSPRDWQVHHVSMAVHVAHYIFNIKMTLFCYHK